MRLSIFGEPNGKDKGVGRGVHGHLTTWGAEAFERARHELGQLFTSETGRVRSISDSDTIEYLVRGHAPARHYIRLRYGK